MQPPQQGGRRSLFKPRSGKFCSPASWSPRKPDRGRGCRRVVRGCGGRRQRWRALESHGRGGSARGCCGGTESARRVLWGPRLFVGYSGGISTLAESVREAGVRGLPLRPRALPPSFRVRVTLPAALGRHCWNLCGRGEHFLVISVDRGRGLGRLLPDAQLTPRGGWREVLGPGFGLLSSRLRFARLRFDGAGQGGARCPLAPATLWEACPGTAASAPQGP